MAKGVWNCWAGVILNQARLFRAILSLGAALAAQWEAIGQGQVIIFPPGPCVVPANDYFAAAKVISGPRVEVQGTNTCATAEAGEPSHGGVSPSRSLWYRWSAPFTGEARVSAGGLAVGIYEGESLSNLAVVQTASRFTAVRDRSYVIAVDSAALFPLFGQSVFTLRVEEFGLRYSPRFSSGPLARQTIQFEAAPIDPGLAIVQVEAWAGEESLGVLTSGPFVFSVTAANAGSVVIRAAAKLADGSMAEMAAETVYFKDGNDDFANGTVIPEVLVNRSFSYQGRYATFEPGEPVYEGDSGEGSLWWKWTPKYGAPTAVDSGTAHIFVFKGESLANLELVAHSPPNSIRFYAWGGGGLGIGGASFISEAGVTYRFALVPGNEILTGEIPTKTWSLRQRLHFATISPEGAASAGQSYKISLDGLQDAPIPLSVGFKVERQTPNISPFPGGPSWVTVLETNLSTGPDFSWDWIPSEPGSYRIWAKGLYGFEESSFSRIDVEVYASNDSFALPSRISLDFISGSVGFTTDWASVEEGEPVFGTNQLHRTVWWKWTPEQDAQVRLKALTGAGGLPLEVFTGEGLATLERVAHNDGRAMVQFLEGLVPLSAVAGRTYYIRASDPRPLGGTELSLVMEALDAPSPGLIILSTMAGMQQEDGMIDWTVFGRVLEKDGSPATNWNYRAQFYAGESLSMLKTAGNRAFISVESPMAPENPAGIVVQGFYRMPTGRAGSEVLVQLRSWDSAHGITYEQARENGGRIGRSKIITVTAGSELRGAAVLSGIGDLVLGDGFANFSPGILRLDSRSSRGIAWRLSGVAGFIYSIERTAFESGWEPILTLTNETGEFTFVDGDAGGRKFSVYRARIVD